MLKCVQLSYETSSTSSDVPSLLYRLHAIPFVGCKWLNRCHPDDPFTLHFECFQLSLVIKFSILVCLENCNFSFFNIKNTVASSHCSNTTKEGG